MSKEQTARADAMNTQWKQAAVVAMGLALGGMVAVAAEAQPDFLAPVKAYAEAMIKDGRDTYGKESSPLFASTLDRKTMKLTTAQQVGEMPGLRVYDRHLIGGNPQLDRGLYETLYELTRVTGDKHYAAEADKALGEGRSDS